MTLPSLTLTTDKRTDSIQKLHLRQSERGLILTAQLKDVNSQPYDLTGMLVRFKDSKAGGKSIDDDNVIVSADPTTGIIKYPLHSQVFAANGVGWFEIYSQDGTLIDSTQNLVINVENDISGTVDNNDYICGLNGLKTKMQGIIDSAQETLNDAVLGANTAVNKANQASKLAQTLVDSVPNDPKYRGQKGDIGPVGPAGPKGDKGDTGQTGLQGERGNQIYKSFYEDIPNGTGYYWSDLSPAVSVDNPPKIGDTVITPSGNIFQIASVHVGRADGYGSYFAVGDVLGNIKGPAGKDGVTPDLTPYLKSADAANTYQTATQVHAIVDAKVVPVANEAAANNISSTNPAALYVWTEA